MSSYSKVHKLRGGESRTDGSSGPSAPADAETSWSKPDRESDRSDLAAAVDPPAVAGDLSGLLEAVKFIEALRDRAGTDAPPREEPATPEAPAPRAVSTPSDEGAEGNDDPTGEDPHVARGEALLQERSSSLTERLLALDRFLVDVTERAKAHPDRPPVEGTRPLGEAESETAASETSPSEANASAVSPSEPVSDDAPESPSALVAEDDSGLAGDLVAGTVEAPIDELGAAHLLDPAGGTDEDAKAPEVDDVAAPAPHVAEGTGEEPPVVELAPEWALAAEDVPPVQKPVAPRPAVEVEGAGGLYENLRACLGRRGAGVVVAGVASTGPADATAVSLAVRASERGARVLLALLESRDGAAYLRVHPADWSAAEIGVLALGALGPETAAQIRDWCDRALPDADLIVVAAPSLAGGANAGLLAARLDGLAIVVEIPSTDRASLETGVQRARSAGADILGIVTHTVAPPPPSWLGRLLGAGA